MTGYRYSHCCNTFNRFKSLANMPSATSADSAGSTHSQESSNAGSETSTVVYGHETFETFQGKVEALCNTLWPDPAAKFTVEKGPGGSFNRIIVININYLKSRTPSKDVILRIPRFDRARPDRETAAVRFVRQNSRIPVPEIVTADLTTNNVLQSPYTIQSRVPGISLLTTFPNLSQSQKLQIAKLVGQVLAQLLEITSPVSGVIEESPEKRPVTKGALVPKQRHRGFWKYVRSTLARKPTVTSRLFTPYLGSHRNFLVRPFDIKGPYDDTETAKAQQTNDLQGRAPQEEVLQMLLDQFARWKTDWITNYPDDDLMAKYYDGFSTIAEEMQRLGVLENDKAFTLCHLDFEPRNILIELTPDSSSSLSLASLTGILDWDSAVFAPKVMSCTPPSWIWAWADDESEDEAAANDVPPTSEGQDLKKTFEAAVGPEFLRLCYEPHHRLLRQLIKLAIFGMHSNEELRDADRLLEDWANLKSSLAS